ncbi:muscular LMNA-interacting protein isoform X1 [Notechis scutatus]|uniref:Muscular LMNA-interacting protein isoform X1 n=1 Tax=Notechis scutatus TaxID=8663 RepID=A0A6J1TQW6_9SAUR|nr:muscular LMNA-interacting protein isoform X1 [Notechis scutatus]
MEIEKCKRVSSAKDILSQEKLKVPLESGFLKFTFVPSLGRLPTQCYLSGCTTFCNEVIAETKEVEKSTAIGSGIKGTGEAASCRNKHKLFKLPEDKTKGGRMDGEDLFKAEFVLITDSDEDTEAILGNDYGHESSGGLAAFYVSSGDECKGQENVPQMPQRTDLPCSSATSQKPSQLTSSLSASDHLSHKSPAAPLLSPTNLKVEHGMAVPGHQASSQQESHSQWRSANGSCIQQTSTYFQSTTSSSLPSSVPKILPSSFKSLVDRDQSPHHVQTYNPEKEPTSLSLPLSKDPCPPSQVVSSTDAFQGSSPQAHSPLPPKKLVPWSQVPIHITTHILSPSPTQLPPSLHGSSSNVYNVNSHCSQTPFSGTPPTCRVKSPLPTRLSLLTAILKSGSSPKRPFSPASCPATFSPNSFDSSTLATEQKFKTVPPNPKKAASQFSVFRSYSPYQDEGYFPGLSDAPRNRMVSSKSSPTLQTWSLSPKRTLDTGARSPDKLRPLSPIISSYRKTVVSPLLKPKLTSFSLPPHVSRQSVLKTRGPGKSTKVRTSSPTFAAKSHPAPTFAVNQRPTLSPTAQKLSYSPAPVHSSNQPKEHLRHVSAKDQGTNLSTHWPFYHQDSPSSIPPSCNINSPLLRTSASSPLHSNFRICSPCSRHKSPPAITSCGSLARKHSPCPQLSRSRQTSSPLSFSLPSDCENKTPQSYKINASYKTFAAIPTNTLLLEQKALDEQTKAELEVEDRTLDTHSEMCSPAQLRQQTEELCAAIDEVLQEPLARRRCNSSPGSLKSTLNSNMGKMSTAPQRPAGRETKYANLYLTAPAVTGTHKMYIPPFLQELKEAYLQQPCETKPGVIRPTTVKAKIIKEEEEPVLPNPFRKYLEERSDLQTEQTTHPIVPIPENEALSSKELSSVRRKDKPPYQEDLSEGNFLDTESPHPRGHSPLIRNSRNNFAKLS